MRKLSIQLAAATATLVSLGFASEARTQEAPDGAKIFASRCGDCHGARAIAAWGRKEKDAGPRRVWLDGFLRKHYPPSDADRAAILDHIDATLVGKK